MKEKTIDVIIIHESYPEDAPGIVEVRRKTFLSSYPNMKENITPEDILLVLNLVTVEEEISKLTDNICNNTNFRTWVAKRNDEVIGFATAQKENGKCKIGPFYINDGYQGYGLGKKLMYMILNWLKQAKEISLEVVSYNTKAIAFYKRFGFVENGVGTDQAAKLSNGKIIPLTEMVLRKAWDQNVNSQPAHYLHLEAPPLK